MVPMASSDDPAIDEDLPLPLIVFSCGICQATIPEVYATKESNQGFHSGSGDDDGIVTKLWIAECSHITCGKHLPGGAAPFHPDGEQPRASCPQCLEKGDNSDKDLYGIRGLGAGEIDTVIPDEWMSCPAIQLDGAVAGMEAVRFQYMNLARYAQRVTRYWKLAERHQHAIESAYSKERKQRRQVQQEITDLKVRVEELEKVEAKLQKWEKRKPLINHYLSVVHEMAKEIETMRTQLSDLGYDVPKRSYTFEPDAAVPPKNTSHAFEHGNQQAQGKSFGSSSTTAEVAQEKDHSSSLRKRKLGEYVPGHNDYPPISDQPKPRGSSRDMMPPPLPKLKPLQRSERPLVDHATGRPSPAPHASRESVRVYEDNTWRAEGHSRSDYDHPDGPPNSSQQHRLPFRPSPSTYTRPSDIGLEQQQMQHGDSHYIVHETQPHSSSRLASHDERRSPPSLRDASNHSFEPAQGPFSRQYARTDSQPRVPHYDLDYGIGGHRPDSRVRQPLQPFSASQLNRQPALQTSRRGQATPSPQRPTQPPAASVISPFFRRGAASRPETQRPPTRGSFVQHSFGAQARNMPNNHRMAPSQPGTSQGYNQRPTLNGLSFIERPYGDNHQPLFPSPTYQDPRHNHYASGFAVPQTPRNSQGLFQRPDRPQPSVAYAPSRPQSTAQHGRITFPPSQQSAMPLGSSQEQTLSQIRGVRGVSSQGVRPNTYQNGPLYDASRNLFSSAGGRRSVRR